MTGRALASRHALSHPTRRADAPSHSPRFAPVAAGRVGEGQGEGGSMTGRALASRYDAELICSIASRRLDSADALPPFGHASAVTWRRLRGLGA